MFLYVFCISVEFVGMIRLNGIVPREIGSYASKSAILSTGPDAKQKYPHSRAIDVCDLLTICFAMLAPPNALDELRQPNLLVCSHCDTGRERYR
jgi:hypothetical protein